jgi:hypothetical protein
MGILQAVPAVSTVWQILIVILASIMTGVKEILQIIESYTINLILSLYSSCSHQEQSHENEQFLHNILVIDGAKIRKNDVKDKHFAKEILILFNNSSTNRQQHVWRVLSDMKTGIPDSHRRCPIQSCTKSKQ